jgi:hypothetical protein
MRLRVSLLEMSSHSRVHGRPGAHAEALPCHDGQVLTHLFADTGGYTEALAFETSKRQVGPVGGQEVVQHCQKINVTFVKNYDVT